MIMETDQKSVSFFGCRTNQALAYSMKQLVNSIPFCYSFVAFPLCLSSNRLGPKEKQIAWSRVVGCRKERFKGNENF